MPYSLGTNDDLTRKLWSSKVERESLPATILSAFAGKEGSGSVLTIKDDTSKRAGDRIRIPYLHLSNQAPIKGVPIDGNEHSMEWSNYDILVDKQSHAERREVDLTDQRAEFDYRSLMKNLLVDRWVETIEISLLNVLGGNSLGTNHDGTAGFDANNTITEPTANYRIFSGTGNTDDADLAGGDVLDSSNIRAAATLAETLRTQDGRPVIKRAKLAGASSPMWALVMPPRQRDHLYSEASTAGSFFEIQRSAMQGGDTGESNILKGRYANTTYQKLGNYAGVCLYVDPYTPYGNTAGAAPILTSVDRSIFVGAGAGGVGFGRKTGGFGKFMWSEEMFRYAEEYGIAAKLIWGAVKAVIDSEDLATIVISSHADAA